MARGKKKKGKGILDSGGFGWPVFGVGHHNTGPEGGWGSQDSLGGPGDTGPVGGGTFGSQARSLGSAARFASLKPTPTKPKPKPSKPSRPKKGKK